MSIGNSTQNTASKGIRKRLAKLKSERRKIIQSAKARAKVADAMDRLAVKIVSLVANKLTGGKLYAYDGIEASRAVRALLMRAVARQ